MNFTKLATKGAAGVVSASMLLATMSPVFAQDNTWYPSNNNTNGVRMVLMDNETDLADYTVAEMSMKEDEETKDLGTKYIYGDGGDDDSNVDSYNEMRFYFDSEEPTKFAIVAKDSSNTNNPVYDVWAYNGTSTYQYTVVDDTPKLDIDDLESDFYDAAIASGDVVDDTWSGTTILDIDDTGSGTSLDETIGNSDQEIGDPDVLADYMDEVWVYVAYTDADDIHAYHFDLDLASDDSSTTPAEPEVSVVARGPWMRVDITPPDDLGSIVEYVVEISPAAEDDTDAVDTTSTRVFFETEEDDQDYDITVTSVNAEGDTSDDVTEENVNSNLVDIDVELSDLDSDSPHYNDVRFLYQLGVIDGSSGDYNGTDPVARAQLTKFIVNAFGLPLDVSGENFNDVDSDHSLYSYILAARNAGVIVGYTGGDFKPDQNVTRQEAATMIARASEYYDQDALPSGNGSFPDVDEDSDHLEAIEDLAGFGEDEGWMPVFKGYSNGKFGPDDPLTRYQMASIVLRAAGQVEKFFDDNTDAETFIYFDSTETTPDDYDSGTATLLRPFVAPLAVEGFSDDDGAAPTDEVELSWDEPDTDETSIDFFYIEVKKSSEDDSDYDVMDSTEDTSDIDEGRVDADVTSITDDGLSDNTSYTWRISACKYIPFDFALDGAGAYADQSLLEADSDEMSNWVCSETDTTSHTTDES